MSNKLLSLPEVAEVIPSSANFVLIRTQDATRFVERCQNADIIVRDRSNQLGLGNCVRVTVGTSEQTDALINALTIEDNE